MLGFFHSASLVFRTYTTPLSVIFRPALVAAGLRLAIAISATVRNGDGQTWGGWGTPRGLPNGMVHIGIVIGGLGCTINYVQKNDSMCLCMLQCPPHRLLALYSYCARIDGSDSCSWSACRIRLLGGGDFHR